MYGGVEDVPGGWRTSVKPAISGYRRSAQFARIYRKYTTAAGIEHLGKGCEMYAHGLAIPFVCLCTRKIRYGQLDRRRYPLPSGYSRH